MKKLKFIVALAVVLLLVSGCQRKVTLTQNDAQAIALEDAGYTAQEVWDLEVELDRQWSGAYYEVSFEASGKEYEYKIDAQTGEIRHRDADRDDR